MVLFLTIIIRYFSSKSTICCDRAKKKYSDVNINLYSNNSQETIKNLLSHNADVAFVVKEKLASPELIMTHLFDVDFCFIVASNNKYAGETVELKQLLKEPFLLREHGSSTREL